MTHKHRVGPVPRTLTPKAMGKHDMNYVLYGVAAGHLTMAWKRAHSCGAGEGAPPPPLETLGQISIFPRFSQ